MNFWEEFMKVEKIVVHHLKKNTDKGHKDALKGVEHVGKISGYELLFQIGINLRNGKKFNERKNTIELIISPNWDRKKVENINEIYAASRKINLPSYWSIIKYQVFAPSFIYDLKVKDIGYENFEYCAQLNFEGKSAWVGILLFINDKLAKKILKEKKSDEKNPESNEWELDTNSLEGQAPLLFLNAAVGEYNMITRIKAVEFLPASSHATIPRYSIVDLHQEFEKIDRQDYSEEAIHNCIRCGYYSYQLYLTPCGKCKKIYYCDDICKNADSVNHNYVCK